MGAKHSTQPPAVDAAARASGPGATATIRPLDVSTRAVTPLDLK